MSVLQALNVAVEMATRQRDDARRALQSAESAREAARGQLEQLQSYAQETEGRWGMREDAEVKPEVMFHHYQFMGRLGHAMGLQSGVIEDHDGRVERARQALLQAELRLASLQKVLEKRHRDLQTAHDRREQKQTDERASLKYSSANNTNSPVGQE